MNVLLSLMLIISVFIIIALICKLMLIKKDILNVVRQLNEKLDFETNTLIDIQTRDKSVRKLAAYLNSNLEELNTKRWRYEKGDTELKNALINISHDMRTPLTAILGYIDLLLTQENNDKCIEYINIIKTKSEKLKTLTSELLDYSIISSEPKMKYEAVNLNKALEDSVISFYAALKNAGIDPNISLPQNVIFRNLDASSLSRIFSNIISNAIKYSDGDLKIVLEEDGTITFTNTASNLTVVEVGKLFDRFYTLDSARKSTGLGLSIAKDLTRKMGGMITGEYQDDKLSIKVSFNKNN